MESSIAPHLRRERAVPPRRGEDFRPPFPAFSARFPATVTAVVMAYFGIQYGDPTPPPAAVTAGDALLAALGAEDGAGKVDRAHYVDEAGYDTRIVIAYWDDVEVFDRWADAHPWPSAELADPGIGLFSEIVRPSVERFETVYGGGRLEGIGGLASERSDAIREHAYWGSARDRLPIAQGDALVPDGEPVVTVDGARRTVRPGANVCLIRSGQDWTRTAGAERATYLEQIEPTLRAGMTFLRDDGHEVGCYVNRYLTVLDDDWQPTDRTFGLSWWRSLQDLDRWAEEHPTHLAIFGAAMKYFAAMAGEVKLRLYHEVTVARRDDATFAYLNCHDRTGMLRAVANQDSPATAG